MNNSIEVEGLAELEKALLDLGAETGFKTLRSAGRKAMKPVLSDMQSGANESTGDLKQSLRISASKGKGAARSVNVSVGNTRRKATKANGGQKFDSVEWKARAQEFGTVNQQAEPFMVPALVRNQDNVLLALILELKIAIDKAVKKSSKGQSK